MDRNRAVVLGALLAMSLCGCGAYPLKESQIEETLPTKTVQIVKGQTDRAAVRQLLGEPWLASRYWGFDLFRVSDKNSQIILIFLPMGYATEDVIGFVLVAYDSDAAVIEYEQQVTRDPGVLFEGASIPVDAALEAGDARFQATPDGREAYVSAAVASRERYLRDASAGAKCRVVLGCMQAYCPARIAVDGGQPLQLPTGLTSVQPEVAVVSLSPGRHRVEATPGQQVEFAAEATELTCAAGQVHYVALRLEPVDRRGKLWFKRQFTATFEVTPQMPEAFRESPLLLWLNGQWLVEAEPGQ